MAALDVFLYSDFEFDEIVTRRIDEILFEYEDQDLTYEDGIELMLIHLSLRACENFGRERAALQVKQYMQIVINNFNLPA